MLEVALRQASFAWRNPATGGQDRYPAPVGPGASLRRMRPHAIRRADPQPSRRNPMQLRLAAALLTLALPVLAQNPAATEAENVFFKAFYLEKGERDLPGAMALYEKFLAMAPDHPKAKVAAQQQFA